ncbi:hypothetical protein [Mycobacterium leprae]|nr:hypothetical protein [Mycobacterium leprae]
MLLADIELAKAVIAERKHIAATNSTTEETTFLLLARATSR